MLYTVKQLADLAGVSVRTLHYYDEIELLKPNKIRDNRYRYYEEKKLLKLQQILFFGELDFPLDYIKRIISSPSFDILQALRDQKKLIEIKKKRFGKLIKTIDMTIKKIDKENAMEDKELYGSFAKEEMVRYIEEARQRWSHSEVSKQPTDRLEKWIGWK